MVQLRKARLGGIYRTKIGIKKGRATRMRGGRGFVQSSDETKTVGMKNTDFYSGRLYWVAPLWRSLGHREQILHVADDIEYLNRIDISRERVRGGGKEGGREKKSTRQRRVKNMKFFRRATEPIWKIDRQCDRT